VTYHLAKQKCHSEASADDLADMLGSLREAGFVSVQFLVHSMGARWFLNSWGAMGQHMQRLDHSIDDHHDSYPKLNVHNIILLNLDYSAETFMSQDCPELRKFCSAITVYSDAHDGALLAAEMLNCERSVGRQPDEIVQRSRENSIDYVDCIDTTWMDNNVHSIRHQFFNINALMVDDLRRIIVDRTRACQRQDTLLRSNVNTYTFLCAPRMLVND